MPYLDVLSRDGLIRTYVISLVMCTFCQAIDATKSTQSLSMEANTILSPYMPSPSRSTMEKAMLCCNGVLGFASFNVSLNFPCQDRPCCNGSETQAVVPVDMAMGFRFQCMPRTTIAHLCYESGTEVRTSNQDPDFIPRICCPGLTFHVELNQWYAALVVKCVESKIGDNS